MQVNKETLNLLNDVCKNITDQISIKREEDENCIHMFDSSEVINVAMKFKKDDLPFDSERLTFYSFNNFYKIYSLFSNNKEVDLEFGDKKIKLIDGDRKLNFGGLSEFSLVEKRWMEFPVKEDNVNFVFSKEKLNNLISMANSLESKYIKFNFNGETLSLSLYTSENEYNEDISDVDVNKSVPFESKISIDVLSKLPKTGDYVIHIIHNEDRQAEMYSFNYNPSKEALKDVDLRIITVSDNSEDENQ